MKGNKNGVGRSGNNSHRPGCSCAWHTGSKGLPGSSNPMWKGGPLNPNGVGWKAIRRVVWKRDKVCRACGLPPYSNRRLDIHHIVPRRQGGTNDPSNLVGLHHGCHMKVEAGKLTFKYPRAA